MDKHNIRLVGIGLGYNSADGFVESKVWEGVELYVDEKKELYNALGLGQGGARMLLDSEVIKANQLAKDRGVGGNMKGDGWQLGGTYATDAKGDIILEFQQEKFGDHPAPADILKAVGLEAEIPNIAPIEKEQKAASAPAADKSSASESS